MGRTLDLPRVANGQKLVIYAIILTVILSVLRMSLPTAPRYLAVPGVVLAMVGVYWLSAGLGQSLIVRCALMLLMLVPLLNIVVLGVMSYRATKALRAGGYSVGLLGASKDGAA